MTARVLVTRTLSNGDYVEARVTADSAGSGIRTVHTLNLNVCGRTVYNRRESERVLAGLPLI